MRRRCGAAARGAFGAPARGPDRAGRRQVLERGRANGHNADGPTAGAGRLNGSCNRGLTTSATPPAAPPQQNSLPRRPGNRRPPRPKPGRRRRAALGSAATGGGETRHRRRAAPPLRSRERDAPARRRVAARGRSAARSPGPPWARPSDSGVGTPLRDRMSRIERTAGPGSVPSRCWHRRRLGGIVAGIEKFVPPCGSPGTAYADRRQQPLDRFRGIGPDPGHPVCQRRRVLDLRGPDGRRIPRRRGPRRQTLRDPSTNDLRFRPGHRDLRAASRGPARGPGGPRRR